MRMNDDIHVQGEQMRMSGNFHAHGDQVRLKENFPPNGETDENERQLSCIQ